MAEWRVLNLWIEMGKAVRDGACSEQCRRLRFPACGFMIRLLWISRESEIRAVFNASDFSTALMCIDSAKWMMALAFWRRQDDYWIKPLALTCAQGRRWDLVWIALGISAARWGRRISRDWTFRSHRSALAHCILAVRQHVRKRGARGFDGGPMPALRKLIESIAATYPHFFPPNFAGQLPLGVDAHPGP